MASFLNLAANATTVVSANPVKLIAVVINTKGATSNSLTLYDNASAASGTKIGTIDTTVTPTFLLYEKLNTKNGLVAVIANGTAADVTLVWE